MKRKQFIGASLAICFTAFADAATHNGSTIAGLRTALAEEEVVAGDVIRLTDGMHATGEPIAAKPSPSSALKRR